MRFSARSLLARTPRTGMVTLGALGWLAGISALHLQLNREASTRPVVRMGYMPVVANLACPLLDAASKDSGETRFEAIKFSSFAEMAQALRDGHLDAAFMIAPLAIVLHQQGGDVNVVYIGNRHESTLVVRRDLPATDFAGLAGRTLAVPQRFSGHNICALRERERLSAAEGAVRIVEMNPPDMPAALATGAIDGYFVGEPFAFASVRAGKARTLYRVEQLWPGFICNLMVVRGQLVRQRPTVVGELVRGAARSGFWARDHRREAAAIAATYWGQNPAFVQAFFESEGGRIVWDRFVPKSQELQQLADQMVHFSLVSQANLAGLVDDRFAAAVSVERVAELRQALSDAR